MIVSVGHCRSPGHVQGQELVDKCTVNTVQKIAVVIGNLFLSGWFSQSFPRLIPEDFFSATSFREPTLNFDEGIDFAVPASKCSCSLLYKLKPAFAIIATLPQRAVEREATVGEFLGRGFGLLADLDRPLCR